MQKSKIKNQNVGVRFAQDYSEKSIHLTFCILRFAF